MFYLPKSPEAIQSCQEASAYIDWARQRLNDASQGLEFNEEQHRYFFYGREMRSVSSIVEHFSPFDSEAAAKRVSKNPRHELFGKSVEEILAVWDDKARTAASAGTCIHAFGEACALWVTGNDDAIAPEFRDRITADGFAAESPKEISCALWWDQLNWKRYAFVAKETRVVNPMLGYAGTFDLLLYDKLNDYFCIRDYKTNEDLFKWFSEMLLPPLSMIKRNSVGEYTVQQNLYDINLCNLGIPTGDILLIWLKEDNFEEVQIDKRYQKVIEYAVKQLQLN